MHVSRLGREARDQGRAVQGRDKESLGKGRQQGRQAADRGPREVDNRALAAAMPVVQIELATGVSRRVAGPDAALL